jgi:sucrose synthase
MMVNVSIQKSNSLQHVLRKAEEYLSTIAPQTPSLKFVFKFQEICLESVWSETETAECVLEMIQLLFD